MARRSKRVAESYTEVSEDGNAGGGTEREESVQVPVPAPVPSATTTTLEERLRKMKELQSRAKESSRANIKDISLEKEKAQSLAQINSTKFRRKLAKAEKVVAREEAIQRGEDVERSKNWTYSIEDDENWKAKSDKKKVREEKGFTDHEQKAYRKYDRDSEMLQPDLSTYKSMKARALDKATTIQGGQLIPTEGDSNHQALDQFYQNKNALPDTFKRPNEDAIDRVVSHLNLDIGRRKKSSQGRKSEDSDVAHINDRNKQFNKKVNRFYDAYTKEIRDSFERGTAL